MMIPLMTPYADSCLYSCASCDPERVRLLDAGAGDETGRDPGPHTVFKI
jgi:hypothetical protein